MRRVRRAPPFLRAAGRIFLTGLLTLLPLVVTIYFTAWMIGVLERFFGKQVKLLLPDEWYHPGMGLGLGILIIFAVGLLMHGYLFRQLFRAFEHLLLEIPLVRSVYSALRDFIGLFADQKSPALQVVAVKLPGSDVRLLGFVTNADCSKAPDGLACEGEVAVYLPMSYQVGGYTVFVPKEATTPVAMSREDAMKFILTAGLKTAPPAAAPPGESAIAKSVSDTPGT